MTREMHAILAGIPQSIRPAVLITSACALLLLATAVLLPRAAPTPQLTTTAASGAAAAAVRLDARVAHRSGNEVLWQLPPPSIPLRAALFAAPGCTIRATDFFDASPSPGGCPRCAGLPEERRFTREALSRGYAVLAVSSRAECWSLAGAGVDGSELAAVESIIKWWTTEKFPQLADLPLVGIGASSGGYFLSALAARVKFSSVAVMIAEGVYGAMAEIPAGYPPALFVHMPKDAERAALVADSMGKLKAKHVDVREIQCVDFAVSAEFLAERVPGLTRPVTDALVDVLRRKGFLDERGFLKNDGRRTPWKKAAEEAKVLPEGFHLERHVTEELNVAYAYHEFTSLKNTEIFEWFESHMNH